jgi:hypothetical protein
MRKLPQPPEYFVEKLSSLGRRVRDAIVAARSKHADLASPARSTAADTLYAIDTHIEPLLQSFFETWSREFPLILIAEGFHDERGVEGRAIFPAGTPEADVPVRILIDPIDGTRGLMYDKRSAWFLAAAAPNHGDDTRLSHVQAAVQLEIPISKQHLADTLSAVRGKGAIAFRENVIAPSTPQPFALRPSTGDNILHGFATISNFFPGTKELAARLSEKITQACIGETDITRATVFEDQYISTAGQLYELLVGHDRFIADLRPLFYRINGQPAGLCAHPYDLASLLIAQEAGLHVTDGLGQPLDAPFDTTSPISWAGFANEALRRRIEPVLTQTLAVWLEVGR